MHGHVLYHILPAYDGTEGQFMQQHVCAVRDLKEGQQLSMTLIVSEVT
jgi:hypothetical protein